MPEPRISVIIPAYNAAGWVARAIESALNQTLPPHEIIVVDDGSIDATAAVVAAFGSRVRLIRQANGGPGSARDTGIRTSSGDWFALLDADDTWFPSKLDRQRPLMNDPEIGVVHARKTLRRGVAAPPQLSFDLLWERNCVIASTALVRRQCYDAVGGFDTDRALIGVEDYNLWLRVAKAGWVIATRLEWLARYSPTAGSLSCNSVKFMKAELANIESLASRLSLSKATVRSKRERVLAYYATEFLYRRDIGAARNAYSLLLRSRPNTAALVGLGMTLLPRVILDARRNWRNHTNQPAAAESAPNHMAAHQTGTKQP